MLNESSLERVELVTVSQTFDRGNFFVLVHDGERQA
jgi:hypothetical protein